MILKIVIVAGALAMLAILGVSHAKADCTNMQRLSQEHSNDMARRHAMDHAGFGNRAAHGARAENVAMGCATQACAMNLWKNSPGHAANMVLPYRCKSVTRSGKYWTMEIGD